MQACVVLGPAMRAGILLEHLLAAVGGAHENPGAEATCGARVVEGHAQPGIAGRIALEQEIAARVLLGWRAIACGNHQIEHAVIVHVAHDQARPPAGNVGIRQALAGERTAAVVDPEHDVEPLDELQRRDVEIAVIVEVARHGRDGLLGHSADTHGTGLVHPGSRSIAHQKLVQGSYVLGHEDVRVQIAVEVAYHQVGDLPEPARGASGASVVPSGSRS